jgi:hypothetical protein
MATSTQSAVVAAGSGSVGAPPAPTALWQFVIYDRANVALADITTIATSKKLSRRLSRPASASFTVPANDALVATIHTDGYPILSAGRRCLKVRHRSSGSSPWAIWFNGVIWHVEDEGGVDSADTTATAFDAMMWLKFRYVMDGSGDLSTPTFVGRGPTTSKISGGDLIQQIVKNTNTRDGDTGLDTTRGSFSINVPPAWDLSAALTNYPITASDMLTVLTETGALDVTVDPVEDGSGLASSKTGILNGVSMKGGSLSPVHFDYGLGDYSVSGIRRSLDIDGLCNKLWYYLGPAQDVTDAVTGEVLIRRWMANIQGDDTRAETAGGPPNPPQTAVLADRAASRAAYGVAMDIHVYDGWGSDDGITITGPYQNRAMYWRLWQMESTLRHHPREMLFVTPTVNAPFDPLALGLGDIITIKASPVLRGGFTAQQRLYGFDIDISDEEDQTITQLVTSADAE